MNVCPVCDANLRVVHEDIFESRSSECELVCERCGYKYVYTHGMNHAELQGGIYEWSDTDDLIEDYHAYLDAVSAARAQLHAV